MNLLFPLVALGGVAALFFASSSSSTTPAPNRQPLPKPPPPKGPIITLNEDDVKKVITEGYHPIITGEGGAYTPTVDDIMAAQLCLQALGYDIGAVKPDGKIGPKTKAALLAFQKKYAQKQTGTLTKETADVVCGTDKGKVGFSQGRSAGQQDKMAGRPAATDFAARAQQAGVDPSDAAVVASFQEGYKTGYAEAEVGYKPPVSEATAAAAAKKLGYEKGYANGQELNGVDASDSFDASGLAGEYPAYKEGYNAGLADGRKGAIAFYSGLGESDAFNYRGKDASYAGEALAVYNKAYDDMKAAMQRTADRGKTDGAAAGAADVKRLGAGSTGAMTVRDATWTALGWAAKWRPIYIANYDTAYHETPGVDENPGVGTSAAGIGLPQRVSYDAQGRPVVNTISLSDLHPKRLAYDAQGRPYLRGIKPSSR